MRRLLAALLLLWGDVWSVVGAEGAASCALTYHLPNGNPLNMTKLVGDWRLEEDGDLATWLFNPRGLEGGGADIEENQLREAEGGGGGCRTYTIGHPDSSSTIPVVQKCLGMEGRVECRPRHPHPKPPSNFICQAEGNPEEGVAVDVLGTDHVSWLLVVGCRDVGVGEEGRRRTWGILTRGLEELEPSTAQTLYALLQLQDFKMEKYLWVTPPLESCLIEGSPDL